MAHELLPEPLLQARSKFSPHRLVFPVEHPDIYAVYKKLILQHWTIEDLTFARDRDDWNKLSDAERLFIGTILAFFSASDGIVNENLSINFASEVTWVEARMAFSQQEAQESIHQETYALLIDAIIQDPAERDRLFEAADRMSCVRSKAEYMVKYMNQDIRFAKRLAAFAIIEGVFFSASFAGVFWLKTKGLMSGTTTANEYIARDEALHCQFSCLLYSKCANRMTQEEASEMIKEAVDVERAFIEGALSQEIPGITIEAMTNYVKFVSDFTLGMLGHEPVFNVANPFPWMEMQSLSGYSNFFEKRTTDYRPATAPPEQLTVTEDF